MQRDLCITCSGFIFNLLRQFACVHAAGRIYTICSKPIVKLLWHFECTHACNSVNAGNSNGKSFTAGIATRNSVNAGIATKRDHLSGHVSVHLAPHFFAASDKPAEALSHVVLLQEGRITIVGVMFGRALQVGQSGYRPRVRPTHHRLLSRTVGHNRIHFGQPNTSQDAIQIVWHGFHGHAPPTGGLRQRIEIRAANLHEI